MKIDKRNILSASEARKNFYSVIDAVVAEDAVFLLTLRGRAKVILISPHRFEKLQQLFEKYQKVE